jgi:hypothetical protein
MEENRYKLLNEENENVVQFNVVNTTSNPIFVNLFNTSQGLSAIPTSPTYINQPNSIVNSFGATSQKYVDLAINTITGDIYACNSLSRIYIFNSVGVPITTLVYVGANFKIMDYNPVNNQLYAVDLATGDIYVIDCTSFTLTVKITTSILNPTSSTFDITTNTIYYVNNTNKIFSINCATNTQNPNING